MSEVMKDSALAIKLFGKTIGVSSYADKGVSVSLSEQRHSSFASSTSHDTCCKDDESRGDSNSVEEKSTTTTSSSSDEEKSSAVVKKNINHEILIACPRCKSMETKFCYYNNYNTKQPRHFCKNCQRYWTAGGTMRNVPVGSGRRKNNKIPPPPPPPPPHSAFLVTPRGFPVTFYPAAFQYWGGSSATSSVLGKHSREGGEGLFHQSKAHSHRAMTTTMLLQPLSRSLNFHETV